MNYSTIKSDTMCIHYSGLEGIQSQQTPTCTHDQSLIHLTPSPSKCTPKTFTGKAMVNGSAKFCVDAILVMTISPLISISLTK